MEGRYPYIRKTTLDIKPSTIRADNRKEDLTFAVFANLPSGDEKSSSKKDDSKGAKTAPKEDPGWSLIVSRNDYPYTSQTFEIARGDTFCKLDLSAIYDFPAIQEDVQRTEEDDEKSSDGEKSTDDGEQEKSTTVDPPSVQYTVRLVKTGTDDDTALGNILTLTFCEKPQDKEEVHDDGDEYGGRDTYWFNSSDSDDDDDDEADSDDDDDDDDDDQYEVLQYLNSFFCITNV